MKSWALGVFGRSCDRGVGTDFTIVKSPVVPAQLPKIAASDDKLCKHGYAECKPCSVKYKWVPAQEPRVSRSYVAEELDDFRAAVWKGTNGSTWRWGLPLRDKISYAPHSQSKTLEEAKAAVEAYLDANAG